MFMNVPYSAKLLRIATEWEVNHIIAATVYTRWPIINT